jgi:hypothetical protein
VKPSLDRFDFILSDSDDNEFGYLADWHNTSNTPFSLAVERQKPSSSAVMQGEQEYNLRDVADYYRVAFSDWSGGGGQLTRDKPGSSTSKYWDARDVDISEATKIRLGWATSFNDMHSTPVRNQSIVAWGKLWVVYSDPNHDGEQLVVYYDPTENPPNWHYTMGPVGNPNQVDALCFDGEYIYVMVSGASQGIWRINSSATWSRPTWSTGGTDPSLDTIDELVYCAGFIYAAKPNDVGYIKSDGTFETLIPSEVVLSPSVSNIDLSPSGNYVYWMTSNDFSSWVYMIQWNGADKVFEQYLELPNGFVGTRIYNYLGALYIAGYYKSVHDYDDARYGQGAIYVANQDNIALLFDIGPDPNLVSPPQPQEASIYDNRILGMCGYRNFLYFNTRYNIYRWDLSAGGYSQVTSILQSSTTPDPTESWYDAVTWDATGYPQWPEEEYLIREGTITYAASTPPDTYRIVAHSVPKDSYGGRLYERFNNDATALDNSVGTTIEASFTDIWGNALQMGIYDGVVKAIVSVRGLTGSDKIGVRLYTPLRYTLTSPGGMTSTTTTFKLYDEHVIDGREHTVRMTVKEKLIQIFVDGVRVESAGTMGYLGSPEKDIYFSAGYSDITVIDMGLTNWETDWHIKFDQVRYSYQGAFFPGATTPLTTDPIGINIIGSVPYLPIWGLGLATVDPTNYADSGWLETSLASGQMASVIKNFTAIELVHDKLDPATTIKVSWFTDSGVSGSAFALTGETYTVIDIDPPIEARRVKLRFDLSTSDTSKTPVVSAASVLFRPKGLKTYEMIVYMAEKVRDRTGVTAPQREARDYLLGIAGTDKSVDITTHWETCRVTVDALQYMPLPTAASHDYSFQGVAMVRFVKVNQ